jgi:hypothetical protein
MDANVSTMTMSKTMPVQNLCRYISFKSDSDSDKAVVSFSSFQVPMIIDCMIE